jgi:hypothetical protein
VVRRYVAKKKKGKVAKKAAAKSYNPHTGRPTGRSVGALERRD